MKRVLIAIVAVAGVSGLIALLSYHPHGKSLAAANTPAPTSRTTSTAATPGVAYKNGTYTGTSVDVGYGTVQVAAVVSGGKITAVNFLQMPSGDDHTDSVTSQAKPALQQEAISAQSANVDSVTGATSDWQGFKQSLQAALDLAKA